VICLADAPYGRLGFTFDVRDAGALRRMLARTRWLQAPHLGNRFLRAFLYYVIFEYCFAPSEVGRLADKLWHRLVAGEGCQRRARRVVTASAARNAESMDVAPEA
jgi:hypothetical protein